MATTISRRKAAVLNLLGQYGMNVLAVCQGILLVPLYLWKFDIDLYGAWLATGGILVWLGMVDAGLTNLLRQRVAMTVGRGDTEAVAAVIGTGWAIIAAVSMIPVGVCVILSPFVAHWFGLAGENATQLSWAFVFGGLAAGTTMLANAVSSALQGLHRTPVMSVAMLAAGVLGIVFTAGGVVYGLGVSAIPLGLVLRGGLAGAVMAAYLLFVVRRHYGVWPCFRKRTLRGLWLDSGWTFLDRLASNAGRRLDGLVAALILGPAAAPIVVLTRRAWDLFAMFANRIPQVVVPGLAELCGSGNLTGYRNMVMKLLGTILTIALIGGSVCFALNPAFLRLWVPEVPSVGTGYHALLALSMTGFMLFTAVHQALFAAGQIRRTALLGLFGVSVRTGMMFVLLAHLGVVGAPLSGMLARAAALVVIASGSTREVLGLAGIWTWARLSRLLRLIACSLALPVVSLIWPPPTSWGQFVLRASAYLMIVCLVLLLAFPAQAAGALAALRGRIKRRFARGGAGASPAGRDERSDSP